MLSSLAKKLFGSSNERLIASLQRDVRAINALEAEFAALSDTELKEKTAEFRRQLAAGATVDTLLVPSFAVVREAAKRVLGMRHFDVQLIGGMVLHQGMISEMKTGEGKTLVSTLPAYLNALSGKGVHIVTVNDYLAKRDSEWMGKIHEFLGLSVGVILSQMEADERRHAYGCDITYGTNNEYGFDYLRDNMKYSREDMVQRPFHYAIVDEVDSILIDEARTPLIISGPTEDNSALYVQVNRLIPKLTPADYELDEKSRNVTLNEQGVTHMETLLAAAGLLKENAGLYDIENVAIVHHVNQALRAHTIFKRDTDYIVKDGKVIIIDEFTGRMMEGRRYSEGLHQALEAKENAPIQNENQTLASITFQNYFRLYPKLAGMTGTAMTEAGEFGDIYKLDVVEVPTHLPVARQDAHDEIYRTSAERDAAVVALIKEAHARQQPVLVGTVSIEKSEAFAARLKKEKIPHQVLNARYHEQEASIIAQAGHPGAVTIATNMAGRGTDIKLGGNDDMLIEAATKDITDEAEIKKISARIRTKVAADKEIVRAAGGLMVIGTERHESRRIDNQLRGRSGRQGDPGASQFFLSLQDDLMRIFGSERIDTMLVKLGLKEGEAIIHPWMNKAIERAQTKVEQRNYEIRKTLLKFDDVMNDQRKVIYEQRIELMETSDVRETITDMRNDVNLSLVSTHIPPQSYTESWDAKGLHTESLRIYGLSLPIIDWAAEEGIGHEEILTRMTAATDALFAEKASSFSPEIYAMAEKRILLETLDQLWKDHLLSLDHLRQGINLRAYAQRDPLNEYKQEAFGLFEHMLNHLREAVISRIARLQIRMELTQEIMNIRPQARMQESRYDPTLASAMGEEMQSQEMRPQAQTLRMHVRPEERDAANPATWGKVGRNDPCPCGSGKKYKHCHGVL
jgi:preprotein translocase subunit SecA